MDETNEWEDVPSDEWEDVEAVEPTPVVKPVKQQSTLDALADPNVDVTDFIKSINTTDVLKIDEPTQPLPDQVSDMQSDKAMPMVKEKSMDGTIEVVKDIANAPSNIMAGVFQRASDLGALAINATAELVGFADKDMEKAMKDHTAANKALWDEKMKEAGTAGKIGQFIGDAIGAQKKLLQVAMQETVKSMSRNDVLQQEDVTFDQIVDVMKEAGTAVTFAGVINRFLPATTLELQTGAGISFESLTKAQQAEKIQAILQAEKLGIKTLDDKAQSKVLAEIMKRDNPDINAIINARFKDLRESSKQAYSTLYRDANIQGKEFGAVPKNKLSIQINQGMKQASETGTLTKSEQAMAKKIQGEIEGYGEKGKILNLADINRLNKSISNLAKTEAGKSQSHIIDSAKSYLDDYSLKIQNEAGITDNIYGKAKEAWMKHKIDFEGKIAGEGQEAGKKVKKILDEETGDAVEYLFNAGMKNTQVAKRIAKDFNVADRQAIVIRQATNGLDLNRAADIDAAVTRFTKMKPDTLKIMIGDKASREIIGNLKLLNEISASGGKLIETTLPQDLKTIFLGATVKILHPLKGASMVLAGAGNIVRKTTSIFQDYDKLIARTKLIKSAPVRNKTLHLINKMYAGYKSEEAKNSGKSLRDKADMQLLKQYE